MQKVVVERVPVPAGAIRGYEFAPIDYADAFRVAVPGGSGQNLKELAQQVFGEIESFPHYVQWLLKLRDFVVKPFGLKTAADIQPETQHGNGAGFFRIFRQSDDELILGEDDKHLDFRLSFLRADQDGQAFLIVSTFVRFNNFLGKIYFTIIKPFHAWIVPDTIQRGIGNLLKAKRCQKIIKAA